VKQYLASISLFDSGRCLTLSLLHLEIIVSLRNQEWNYELNSYLSMTGT